MIILISNEFNINLLEAEEIYLSKFRTINSMFENSDIETMTKSTTYLYNKFAKFAIDYKIIENWKRIQVKKKT